MVLLLTIVQIVTQHSRYKVIIFCNHTLAGYFVSDDEVVLAGPDKSLIPRFYISFG